MILRRGAGESRNSGRQAVKQLNKQIGAVGLIQAQCDQFVDQYEDVLVKALMANLDPKIVCTELNVCPGASCLLCKTVVSRVRTLVNKNETRAHIRDALYKVSWGP